MAMYIGDVVDRLLSSDNLLGNLGLRPRAHGHAWGTVGSFGAGLIVGSVLGLLFAPKPGSDLRREVAQRAHDWRGDGQHRAEDPTAPPS